MQSTYLVNIPGNTTVAISQDELRSLLGKIEAELHNSQVYRSVLARLQKLLGDSSEQAKILCKALGREAIGLAFQQFTQPQNLDSDRDLLNVESENSSDLSNCLTKVQFNSKKTRASLEPKEVTTQTVNSVSSSENISSTVTENKSPKPKKKLSKTEQAQQIAAAQRLEIMRQIGQQLKQARESQHLSLNQLNIYTHVPIHQMQAVEAGDLELLPEDICVRGFIRVMGNSLGLNGTNLAASLPALNTVQSILPSWCKSKNTSTGLALDIRPIHLYLGYTAIVAGSVGGLSYISQEATVQTKFNPDIIVTPSSSSQKIEKTTKSQIKSSSQNIAPPESL